MADENETRARDSAQPGEVLCPPGLALLVLDLQPSFIRALPDGDVLLQRCALVVEAARVLEIPTAFTEQVPEKLGATAGEIRELQPEAPAFSKTGFSCFGADGLEDFLREREIDHLLIAGLETPICVYQSVLHAGDNGFEATVLSDCVGARRAADAPHALRALAAAGAHVLPAEAVLYSILGHSAHPAFREITALVKKYDTASPA